MKILVINGSPKGKNSTTLHTALYLEKLDSENEWSHFDAGAKIKSLEKDFAPLKEKLEEADAIIWAYPVYTFIAPYQLHRTVELIKESGARLEGKYSSQITTSKHFYDWTAQRWCEEISFDLGLKVVPGLAADMDDLLTDEGQKDARLWLDEFMFSVRTGLFETPSVKAPVREKTPFTTDMTPAKKTTGKDVVIVTNAASDDENLLNMISHFRASLKSNSRVVNVRAFPFRGGCLGCFSCASDGKCIYTDGFDTFLREEIQKADAIVYAFTIENHFTHSSMKCYDDRQFCNGHRTVTRGIPTAYIVSGDLSYEANLRNIIEGRCQVGGNFLSGIATDEGDTASAIERVAAMTDHAMEAGLRRPANFLGVGGMKIFRDLIWVMRGLMKADHKFYKENGIYDFPQKKKGTIMEMKAVGAMMAIPSVRKKMRGKMSQFIIMPYRKVVEKADKSK